jgi:hypothetical protein
MEIYPASTALAASKRKLRAQKERTCCGTGRHCDAPGWSTAFEAPLQRSSRSTDCQCLGLPWPMDADAANMRAEVTRFMQHPLPSPHLIVISQVSHALNIQKHSPSACCRELLHEQLSLAPRRTRLVRVDPVYTASVVSRATNVVFILPWVDTCNNQRRSHKYQ